MNWSDSFACNVWWEEPTGHHPAQSLKSGAFSSNKRWLAFETSLNLFPSIEAKRFFCFHFLTLNMKTFCLFAEDEDGKSSSVVRFVTEKVSFPSELLSPSFH